MNRLTKMQKAILLGVIHLGLILSLGGKLLLDRVIRPRVWAKTVPYDPYLPIRGRYLTMRVEAEARGFSGEKSDSNQAKLIVENGKLVAVKDPDGSAIYVQVFQPKDGPAVATLSDAVAYFIPEHAEDPTRLARASKSELWVEVTIPKKGPPRPIRMGLRNHGVITPLDVK